MTPYYEDQCTTIYLGDCREILPQLPAPTTIITDPVWPNAVVPLFGSDDPVGMMRQALAACPALPTRLAIQMGCNSDPRFTLAVPPELPFFRVAWLEVVRTSYRGRLMVTGDVAYLFGEPPPSIPGQHVIPGRFIDADHSGPQSAHPCPRKLAHVKWLVKWWSAPGEVVVDPFMGSGTTLLAAKNSGRRAVGIEIEEAYCEMAAKRLCQSVMF